jgi:hypothetical protein
MWAEGRRQGQRCGQRTVGRARDRGLEIVEGTGWGHGGEGR